MIFLGVCGVLLGWFSLLQMTGAISGSAGEVLGSAGVAWLSWPWWASLPVGLAGAGLGVFALGRSAWARELVDPGRGDQARWRRRAFALVLVILLGHVAQLEALEWRHLAERETDFKYFHTAAQAWGQGEDIFAATSGLYFYPPVFQVLFFPLSLLPVGVASLVWLWLKLIILLDALRRVEKFLRCYLATPAVRQAFLFGILFVTGRFWLADLAYGNTNILITWLVILVLTAEDDPPWISGVGLALAAALKVVPGLLIVPLVLQKRRRTLAWAGLALVVLCAAPMFKGPAVGLQAWESYYRVGVTDKLAESLAQPDNQSLRGFCERLLPGRVDTAKAVWALLSCALVGWAGWLTHRTRKSGGGRLALAMWPGVILVVSPGSWVVHYIGVMLPAAAMLALLMDLRERSRILLAIFVLANLAWTVSGWSRWSVRHSIAESWFLIALLMVLGALGMKALGVGVFGQFRRER